MNEDLKNLARHVKARRDQKGWSQLDVWKENGGPSNSKLTEIEAARPPAPARSTLKKLDLGLQWTPGSARRVLEGGEPTPIQDVTETVALAGNDESTLLYRQPEDLTDDEWREITTRDREHHEWLIEQAYKRRRG